MSFYPWFSSTQGCTTTVVVECAFERAKPRKRSEPPTTTLRKNEAPPVPAGEANVQPDKDERPARTQVPTPSTDTEQGA